MTRQDSAAKLAFSTRAFNEEDSVGFQRNRKIGGLTYDLFRATVAAELERRCGAGACGPIRILDVGCGSGPWIEAVIEHARGLSDAPPLEITGIDAAGRLVDFAKERLGAHANVRLDKRAFQDLDDSRKFAIIYFVDVVQHVASCDYPLLFRNTAGLLEPGGCAILVDKEKYSRYGLKMQVKRWLGMVPHYYLSARYPSFRLLRRLAGEAGLQVVRELELRQFRCLFLTRPA